MITDHLSRLEKTTEEEKGSEIANNFSDEQLFLLLVQTPRYADRPKTCCVKYTPMDASARVAPSNIVYQWYEYRSTGTGVLNTKICFLDII